jgi:hypothetical protein
MAGLATALVVAVAVALSGPSKPETKSASASATAPKLAGAPECRRTLKVVTAASFVPALTRIANSFPRGANCLAVEIQTADGLAAADVVATSRADVWIPDDSSWPSLPGPEKLAPAGTANATTIIATSPLYLVTQATAPQLPSDARSYLGLTRELSQPNAPLHLALRDPSATGDGMVAAGAMAYAELETDGPLVSALDLLRTWQAGTTIVQSGPGFPTRPDQVGIVPEYALLASGQAGKYTAVAPTDGTALLRYTWLPTALAAADPNKTSALAQLFQALSGASAEAAYSASGLRGPVWPAQAPGAASAANLPALKAAPMDAVPEHLMYHVLATWQPELRRSNMLIVLDVSGSMAGAAPHTRTSKIALAQQGITEVMSLLPNDARLGLWQFGSQLDPPADWQSLVAPAPLGQGQRAAIANARAHLQAHTTGTGLYDTILAAYRYQQQHFQAGMPNEVAVFTDGVNQDDPVSMSLGGLNSALAATDPNKRVQLSIFGIGNSLPADDLNSAIAPVGGQVDLLANPDQVLGAFVHAVSGALSGTPG